MIVWYGRRIMAALGPDRGQDRPGDIHHWSEKGGGDSGGGILQNIGRQIRGHPAILQTDLDRNGATILLIKSCQAPTPVTQQISKRIMQEHSLQVNRSEKPLWLWARTNSGRASQALSW